LSIHAENFPLSQACSQRGATTLSQLA